jgi:hypothetical protein
MNKQKLGLFSRALIASSLLLSGCGGVESKNPQFSIGSRVNIDGVGYYNPGCNSIWGVDSRECAIPVPRRGEGEVKDFKNGTYRVCDIECGWYPVRSLSLSRK